MGEFEAMETAGDGGLDRRVTVDDIPPDGLAVEMRATPAQLAAIAARFGVEQIDELSASLRVAPTEEGEDFLVEGFLRSRLTQTCGVTLAPLHTVLEVPVSVRFTNDAGDGVDDWDVSETNDDPPEPIVGGAIDLGEIVQQLLAVEIDPFPRAPDVPYRDLSTDKDDSETHPFSGLAALRDKLPE